MSSCLRVSAAVRACFRQHCCRSAAHGAAQPVEDLTQSVLPDTGMFDLSPMVAILLLQVLERVLISVAYGG